MKGFTKHFLILTTLCSCYFDIPRLRCEASSVLTINKMSQKVTCMNSRISARNLCLWTHHYDLVGEVPVVTRKQPQRKRFGGGRFSSYVSFSFFVSLPPLSHALLPPSCPFPPVALTSHSPFLFIYSLPFSIFTCLYTHYLLIRIILIDKKDFPRLYD